METRISARRVHYFSSGHRVHGHEGKCAHLHGHEYAVTFEVSAYLEREPLDEIGRVVDFGVIKALLCDWLEDHWDHHFLVSDLDPWRVELSRLDPEGVVIVPFNPTAENMAVYLLEVIGPTMLLGSGLYLTRVTVEETRKCAAEARQ